MLKLLIISLDKYIDTVNKKLMHKGTKIVIIEDDQSISNLFSTKLRLEGFLVKQAFNGIEGLDVIEEFKPDLILLDLMMPEMNGDEMLEKLRQKDWAANIRVIVLTNISKDEAPANLRFLNVDRYIVKAHHTPAQITEIVKEVLF